MKPLASLLVAFALVGGPMTRPGEAVDQGPDCGSPSFECAAASVKAGDFDTAVRTLKAVIARDPRNANALHLLGIALTSTGRIADADQQYRAALAVNPKFYPASRNLGINEFNAGHLEEAKAHFERVLRHAPNDEIAHLHLGEIHHDQQRHDIAVRHYRKSGTLVSEHPPWLLHFATSLLEVGDRTTALGLLERLPRADATSRFEAGVALGRSGAYVEAAEYFGSARAAHSNPYAAGYNQVLMLTRAGLFNEVVRVGEDLLTSGTRTAELYHLVSRGYLDASRVREAIDALREAARLEPTREDTYVDLALICLTHGDFDLGLEVIGIGLQHQPSSAALHLHRGVLLTMRGELGRAEQAFEASRRLAPASPAAISALAMLWIEGGDPDRAVRELRDVHKRFNDPVLSYVFALALIRSGVDPSGVDAAEALDALKTAIEAQPGFAPSHAELGRLLLRRGEVDEAIASLERAVAADQRSTAALYNLAQAYRKKGNVERARELLADLTTLHADTATSNVDQDLRQLIFGVVKAR